MGYYPELESEKFYHIYNRGINGTRLFYQERNYRYFLEKYAYHCADVMDTFAYCLLGNHFHLLVRIKSEAARTQERYKPSPKGKYIVLDPSKQIAKWCGGYAQAINKQEGRTGDLFEEPFDRILVDNEDYLNNLIEYIHKNPVKHGFTEDFTSYPYSSYESYLSERPTRLPREQVLEGFGDREKYKGFHAQTWDWREIERYIIEWD